MMSVLCTDGQDVSSKISDLFHKLDSARTESSRMKINDSIRLLIEGYAKSDTVFDSTIRNTKMIGQLTSSDKKIRIINWNLVLPDNKIKYYCYIIKKGEKNSSNELFSLSGNNYDQPLRADTTYTINNWYGALYYDISSIRVKSDIYYILLGIDIGKDFINRKFIEVLSFGPDGDLLFGKKWFDTGKRMQHRVIFEYDATGAMSLRFRSSKMIVFDHLVPLYKGDNQKLTFGAEFTLDSYVFKNGVWKFEKNVDLRNKE